MLELVTLDEAHAQLQLDDIDSNGSAHEAWLNVWIPSISEAVALWLKDDWRLWVPELDENGDVILDSSGDPIPEIDSSGVMTVRPVVRAAVLIELASQFRFREGDGNNGMPDGSQFGSPYGYLLSRGATNLLSALRKATLA